MASATDLIPHRPPFRLVDRVVSSSENSIVCEKLVTGDDPMSDVLVIEAMAQACACHAASGIGEHRGMLVALRDIRFDGRAQPGDRLKIVATRSASMGSLARFSCEAFVDDKSIARGELTFVVEPAPK